MVLACAVCFGQSDAPMAIATNMGIFLMLGVTTAVLAGFAAFFVHLARRARLFAGVDDVARVAGVNAAPPAAEGSARC